MLAVSDDQVRVLILQLGAGETHSRNSGLNLTAADHVFFLEPSINNSEEQQAIARAHRMGQERSVTVVRLWTEGTVEECILAERDERMHFADNLKRSDMKGNACFEQELELDTGGICHRVLQHVP